MIVGGGQAWRLADRAVDVSDDAARPAHDVMMVVADASLEPGRAAGRFDAADQSGRGERVQRVINGLQRDLADPIALLDVNANRMVFACPHCSSPPMRERWEREGRS